MITTVNLAFSVSGQTLTAQQEMPYLLASNTVKYVKAHFALGEDWQSVETVSAVWSGVGGCYSMLLDSDGNCFVPQELLAREQRVYVNLVGSDVDNDEVVDRITTYPVNAIKVNATAYTCGSETVPLTPSQFEQFIAQVAELVGSVRDIDRIELNDDYTLTVYFSDGTSWTSTSIRGAQGETGNGIASAVLNADYTLTLTFTDGTSYTTSSIRGAQGEQGEPGEVTLAQLESVLPTDTASGAIASFPDGSDLFDYLSCVVEINPVQTGSGTPSPDNVRPITGWTGCEVVKTGFNVWDEEWEVGGISGTTGQNVTQTNTIRSTNIIPVKPSVPLYVTCTKTGLGASIYLFYYKKDGSYIGSSGEYLQNGVVTPSSECYGIRFQMRNNYGTTYNNDISINYPSTDTTYHAYNGTTYPVSWQTEAGTVYGGTVDLVTGVLTITHGYLAPQTVATIAHDNTFGYYTIITTTLGSLSNNTGDIISNMFVKGSISQGVGHCYITGAGAYLVAILPQTVTTKAQADTWCASNNPVFVYELATPQTYQLTPTQVACLLGRNNVWADCGNVEVEYKADVQRWVEKKLGQ